MDDDLVLNLADDDHLPAKPATVKKGGRWTDRSVARFPAFQHTLINPKGKSQTSSEAES